MAGSGLHNPAPGNARYEPDARPGKPGMQAGQAKHQAIGDHEDKNPGIVKPDYKEESSVVPEMTPINYGSGPERGGKGAKGQFTDQHGPQKSAAKTPLEVDPANRPYGTKQSHAGRGNPGSPG